MEAVRKRSFWQHCAFHPCACQHARASLSGVGSWGGAPWYSGETLIQLEICSTHLRLTMVLMQRTAVQTNRSALESMVVLHLVPSGCSSSSISLFPSSLPSLSLSFPCRSRSMDVFHLVCPLWLQQVNLSPPSLPPVLLYFPLPAYARG
jgi:hypothetical protein